MGRYVGSLPASGVGCWDRTAATFHQLEPVEATPGRLGNCSPAWIGTARQLSSFEECGRHTMAGPVDDGSEPLCQTVNRLPYPWEEDAECKVVEHPAFQAGHSEFNSRRRHHSPVAQQSEHRADNPAVGGANPSGRTMTRNAKWLKQPPSQGGPTGFEIPPRRHSSTPRQEQRCKR